MNTTMYGDSNNSAHWSIYTTKQLNQYFRTIRLPTKYYKHPILRQKSLAGSNDAEALRILTCLVRYQLANIPFENLEVHYSSHHSTSLDPRDLFHKMVERKSGRGGHCMENTYLLVTVLRSLGYNVIATGARVNIKNLTDKSASTGPTYKAWNHMVGIVTIGDKDYLIDVGFGNNSLTFPVPLEDGYIATNGRPSYQLCLHREQIAHSIDENTVSLPMWVYSVRSTKDDAAPWIPAYCFGNVEFLPHDFETMGQYVSQNPRSWFTRHLVCLKFLMNKQTEEIIGDVTLFQNKIKERKNGTSKVLANFKTEQERVEALQKYLGIRLSATEKKGIHGLPSMII